MRRLLRHRGTLLLGTAIVATLAASAPAIPAARAFSVRYSQNIRGDIALVGNTLESCPSTGDATCAAARTATAATLADNNDNNHVMTYVDTDTDAATFDSSTATLSLPATAQVRFAGLYWGADTSAGGTGAAAADASLRGSVKLKVPGASAYTTYTSDRLDDIGTIYQGFRDVTSLVQAAGSGTYAIADVQAGTGTNRYAGWSLVVAYADTTDIARNLTVFDGLQAVSAAGQNSLTVPVTGFATPPAGPVNTRMAVVAYEGDFGLTPDAFSLNGTAVSDVGNAANNFFNASMTNLGTRFSAKVPDYVNQLGYDSDIVNTNLLGNSATSATITLTTSNDTYYPGVVAFATQLYAPIFDQTLAKTAVDLTQPGVFAPGDVVEYTISATNTGNDDSDPTAFSDAIPTGTTFLPGSLRIVSGANAGTLTDGAGDDVGEYVSGGSPHVNVRLGTGATASAGGKVAPNASFSIAFRVTLGSVANATTIVNSAQLGYADPFFPANPLASTSYPPNVAVIRAPDFAVASSHTGTFTRGTSNTYAIDVNHIGDLASSGTITVTDTLPAGIVPGAATGIGWTCTTAAQVVTCSRTGSIAVHTPLPTITVPVSVGESTASSVANAVTVANTSDTTAANNTASDTTSVTSIADLGTTVTTSAGPYRAGQDITYTITIHNAGPSSASGVTLSDPIPASAAVQSIATTQGTCTNAVACTVGTLASGASATITLVLRPLAAAGNAGTLATTATASSSATDSASGDNAVTTTLTVARASDLGLTGSAAPASDFVGENLTYTFTATNGGPNDAAGVAVSDVLPANVTLVSATTSIGSCAGTTTVTCTIGALANAATATVTIVVKPLAAAVGTLSDTATISGTYFDGSSANNSATVSSTVVASSDLTVSVTDAPDPVYEGDLETYTVTVANGNLSPATGVTVTDTLPANVTVVSVTPSQGTCDAATPRVCTLGTVAPSTSATVVFVVRPTAAAATAGSISNTAAVTANEHDPAPAGNSQTTVTTVQPSADIRTTLTSSPGSPIPSGSPLTYTAVVTNAGPSSSTGVSLVDTLPAGVTFGSATSTQGTCSGTTTVTCTIGSLASGASATVTITVTPPAALQGTTIHNVVNATSSQHDPDASSNGGVSDHLVTAPVNLGITLADSPDPVYVGDALTYTATVQNGGSGASTGSLVTLPLPAGTAFDAAASSPSCSFSAGTVSCTIGALANGASATRQIVVRADAGRAGTTLNAVATVAGVEGDPVAGNNQASATTAVLASSDLGLTVTASPTPALAGQPLVYTLTVTNAGPSDATGVVLSDVLPVGPALVSTSITGGGSCTGTATLSCPVGTIPSGGSATVTITLRPSATDVGTTLTESATVSGTEHDPAAASNSVTLATGVIAAANLQVTGTVSGPSSEVGGQVTAHLDVTNAGPSPATGVTFVATVPAGVTVVSATSPAGPCVISGVTVTCTITGGLANGATTSLDLVLSPTAAVANQLIVVNGVVRSNEANPAPERASVTLTVAVKALAAVADLGVTLAADSSSVPVGASFTWTASIVNHGPLAATAVRLSHVLPAGTTVLSATPATGTCTTTATAVDCALGKLAVGASTTVKATLRTSLAGTLSAGVAVAAAETDSALGDNQASISATVTAVGGCTVMGTESPDVLRGTTGDDVICGRGGKDKLYGLAGNDIIYGDNNADLLVGGPGKDTLYGGNGNDALYGGNSNDKLYGGKSRDRLFGGNGKDLMLGGKGNDRLVGGKGPDREIGGKGNDRLAGGKGSDRLYGNAGKDRLDGGRGNDRLAGGKGADTLKGSRGKDRLAGGKGNDLLRDLDLQVDMVDGGPGSDAAKLDVGLDVVKNVEAVT